MAKLSDEQRRALRLLSRSPNGCTEAILLAHGFEVAMLGKLVLDRLAKAEGSHHHGQPPHEGRLAAAHRSGAESDYGIRKRVPWGAPYTGGMTHIAMPAPERMPIMKTAAPIMMRAG
jgi:hypothetical protein